MIDPAFGNWLAGFTDGEGYFTINRHIHGHYRCSFGIKLRGDDRPILEEIQIQTGLGTIYDRPKNGKTNPQSEFLVQSIKGCLALREIFRVHPLRAKKAEDFKIWSEAMDFWTTHKYRDPWDNMADAKKRLEEVRKFRERSQGDAIVARIRQLSN